MVNLLFISSNNKIERVRVALQPQVKVKIDVVADFDFGLKDVFEKRPATVFIQDQIAGVTGESVARHIQMLLGAGAPSFVFLHDGNTKAKPVKGLFEHLIDLSNRDDVILNDILFTLKSQLGLQWDKIFIPPKEETDNSVAADTLSPLLQSQVVDSDPNFNSAPETTESQQRKIDQTLDSAFDSFDIISSTHNQLAEAVAEINSLNQLSKPPINLNIKSNYTEYSSVISDALGTITYSKSIVVPEQINKTHGIDPINTKQLESDVRIDTITASTQAINSLDSSVLEQDVSADFVIVGERSSKPVAPDELLRVFEGSHQQKTYYARSLFAVVLVCSLIAVLGWFFWKGPGNRLLTPKKTTGSVLQNHKGTDAVVPQLSDKTEATVKDDKLPSFVSPAGIDPVYSKINPGWERFVESDLDVRIYRSDGKIKALQVLGGSRGINDALFKTALLELVGDSDYRISSRTNKDGIWVESAVAGQSDVLIYRKGDRIKAFVVSKNVK